LVLIAGNSNWGIERVFANNEVRTNASVIDLSLGFTRSPHAHTPKLSGSVRNSAASGAL
jgi:hypothetical protein